MSEPRVREIDPLADPRWDEFVTSHPDAVVYQHSAWLRCLRAEYPRTVLGLCAEEGDETVAGVLPLVPTRGIPLLRRNASFGARLASLPRTPVAGPLARDRESAAALLGAAVDLARGHRARLQLKRTSATNPWPASKRPARSRMNRFRWTGAPWRRRVLTCIS